MKKVYVGQMRKWEYKGYYQGQYFVVLEVTKEGCLCRSLKGEPIELSMYSVMEYTTPV